jgi:hypothetical protein
MNLACGITKKISTIVFVTCGSCIWNSKDMVACDSVMLQLYHCLNKIDGIDLDSFVWDSKFIWLCWETSKILEKIIVIA